jgi:hypothetical protein
MGRHCADCGGALELNQFFPNMLLPRGDWRSLVGGRDGSEPDEESGLPLPSEELIAFVTERSLPEIDSALSDASRAVFVRDVLNFEVRRRLGNLDYLVWLHEPRESRLPPPWKQGLRIAADHYLSRAAPHLGQALELAEVLRGFRAFHPLARLPPRLLREALHSGNELVREALLELLSSERPPRGEGLWPEVLPLLRSGRREEARFGLSVLQAGMGVAEPSLGHLRDSILERVLDVLAHASEEQLGTVSVTLAAAAGTRRGTTALLVGALGLAPEFLPLLTQPQKRRFQVRALAFLGELGDAAAEAVPWLLERFAETDKEGHLRLFRTLAQVGAGDPRVTAFLEERLGEGLSTTRQAAFTALLELHRAGRPAWSPPRVQRGLAVVREAMAQGQLRWLITTWADLPDDLRHHLLPGFEGLEQAVLERITQKEEPLSEVTSIETEVLRRWLLASPALHAQLVAHARAHPDDLSTQDVLAAVGPETPGALLLIQHRLRERNGHPWHRQAAVELLRRFVGGHASPAEGLLVDIFVDDREDVATRLTAAECLAPVAGRLQPSAQLVSTLRDGSALIRGWAYLLLGAHGEAHARDLSSDPSPAVRQLVAA